MIGVIVEGTSDEEIVDTICKKINKRIKTVSMGGSQIRNESTVKKKIRGLKKEGCKKVIILEDSDEKTGEQKREEIKRELRIEENDIEICVAVCEIESWLLGCFDEYRYKSIDIVPNPIEEIEKLKRKKHGARFNYNKIVDGMKIAKGNDLEHFRKSQSFIEFESKIKDC